MNFDNLIFNNRLGNINCCWLCDDSPEDSTKVFEDHHIVPRHLGGTNGPIVYLCSDCHTNVHDTARDILKGKQLHIKYRIQLQIDKLLYLSNVIVRAEIEIQKNPQNKIYVFNTILDYETHEMLTALVKYYRSNKCKVNQGIIFKKAISELYRKIF